MTTTVAMHVPGKGTYYASDSLIVDGDMRLQPTSKWVTGPDWAIGVAGHMRSINVISEILGSKRLVDPSQVVACLLPELPRRGISYLEPRHGGPVSWGADMLFATPHGLWDIDANFCYLTAPPRTPRAIGSGSEFALGASFAITEQQISDDPVYVLRMMVAAGVQFDINSGTPSYEGFLPIPPPKKSKVGRAKKRC